jgi:glycosyltransferase involved in cell wall biosynthesis
LKKIKIAFIKYAGCASGGTEKFLQTIAANLNKKQFDVDYYYCDATPYIGWQFNHPNTQQDRVDYLIKNNVNLIKFKVEAKDVTTPTHEWVNTNFWDFFDESKYDLIQIARAGHKEYPFYYIKNTPIIDSIWIEAGSDNQKNIAKVLIPSNDLALKWKKSGGDMTKVVKIAEPMEEKVIKKENLRSELNLEDKFIFGFHQRTQDEIFSKVPLLAYSKIQNDKTAFILLGGSKLYSEQAKELNLNNFYHLEFSNSNIVEKFLNTLDVFTHGRKDGETFGVAIVEAMRNSLPVISHRSKMNNGHIETIGSGGRVVRFAFMYSKEMKKLQKNHKYYKLRSKRSREIFLSEYEKSKIMTVIENMYKKVLSI